ncbi:MAG: hypothetical protein U9N62_02780, partial [Thermotogota bacterium]|nr:hypothetical protein [Thermotogota bacterium]
LKEVGASCFNENSLHGDRSYTLSTGLKSRSPCGTNLKTLVFGSQGRTIIPCFGSFKKREEDSRLKKQESSSRTFDKNWNLE